MLQFCEQPRPVLLPLLQGPGRPRGAAGRGRAAGDPGNPGPTGATGTIEPAAYGGLYSDTLETMELTAGVPAALTNLNVPKDADRTILGPSTITIEETGIYWVSYSVIYAFSDTTDIHFNVTANGSNLLSALTINYYTPVDGLETLGRAAQFALAAGDVLELTVTSTMTSGTLALPGLGTGLDVARIA